MIPERRKRNSSKINLTVSIIFHSAVILVVLFFAAREGLVGDKMRLLAIQMAPKDKKPEPPKEKPAPPKIEQRKEVEAPKAAVAAPPAQTEAPQPRIADAAPIVALAPSEMPDIVIEDSRKQFQAGGDASSIYKGLIERALRSHWNRPEELDDQDFVAEVEVGVDSSGQLSNYRWVKGSGNPKWDDSVKAALAKTKTVNSQPPKGFPGAFTIRFDVESMRTEDVMQFSSR